MKKRKPIPSKIEDEVMFAADLLCCVCENRGDHIHHIDNDPSNNEIDNLVLLCFTHHNEVTQRGGLSRRLTPNLLRKYRDNLYRKVAEKRNLPKLEAAVQQNEIFSEDHLFQLMLDAVSVREIQRIERLLDPDDGEKIIEATYDFSAFLDTSGVRARRAILEALDRLSDSPRLGMTNEVAQAISRATYNALPIRSLRSPNKQEISETEVELIDYGLVIGNALAYDGALYLGDIKVVDASGELLWKILRYARINNHAELQERAHQEFDVAENGAERSGDPDTLKLLQLYRKHGMSGDWRNPRYGKHLFDRIA